MTIRWGIVTAGKISHDFVNAFNSYPNKGDQVIAAVAARTKPEEFAKLHNIPIVFDSYKALAESNEIDVAYIGALNPDHYNISKLFLENGKHVLCEKPLCLNYKQAESLIRFAKNKKLFLMEAVWSRFSPTYIAIEKEINSGKLGDVMFVEVNFGVPIVTVDRLRKKELGGSSVMDIGIYTLQFAQYIFKEEPKKVTTVGGLNEDGVDIYETIILEYDGDRRAVLNVDSRFKMWNKATVVGTNGHITIEDPFHFPEIFINTDGTVEKFPLHKSSLPYNFRNSAGLVYQALEVEKCLKEGLIESPRMSHKESLVLAKLEQTVRKQLGVYYDVDDQEFP
ncbi:trans-1,2-dihydrobenzene-1,2-diol dehydrogenase [Bombyx mori]|uniref:Trans-1,2-dihydrobenzene-1,2-diol dehydrogenase n=1 Tax=Bombyx mori TaxID=7091 RepID=A0A8R1WMI4_BOMMO|nr:trans-1,2-dihydrobenzene-1,2-diol dehydrogenase [Bombyx mori]XP_021206312.2 trans-1,2-dihydrobenzene-1,2-diol dehydrogenase [Bombyx mori]